MLASQVAQAGADLEQLLLACGPRLLHLGARLGGGVYRDIEVLQDGSDPEAHGLGRLALADQAFVTLACLGTGLTLLARRTEKSVGTAVQGPGALLGGTQGQTRIHLCLAGITRSLGELLADAGVRLLLGASSAAVSRASRSARPARSFSRA